MIDTFITFHDVELLSSQPPIVAESIPVSGDTLFPAWDSIELIFSRPMDTLSVLGSVLLSPQANVEGFWENSTTLILIPDSLDVETDYVLTIWMKQKISMATTLMVMKTIRREEITNYILELVQQICSLLRSSIHFLKTFHMGMKFFPLSISSSTRF